MDNNPTDAQYNTDVLSQLPATGADVLLLVVVGVIVLIAGIALYRGTIEEKNDVDFQIE